MLVAPELSRDVTIRARRPASRADANDACRAHARAGGHSRAALNRSRVLARQRLHPFGFRLASGDAAWYYTVYNETTVTAIRRERNIRVHKWSAGRLPTGSTVRDVRRPGTAAHETEIPLCCLNSRLEQSDNFTLPYSTACHVVLMPSSPLQISQNRGCIAFSIQHPSTCRCLNPR